MRWWFSASNHDVKIVILAKYDYRRRCIPRGEKSKIDTHRGNILVNDLSVDRTSDDAFVIAGDVTQTSQIADDTSVSQITVKTANEICLESVTIRPRTLLVATCTVGTGASSAQASSRGVLTMKRIRLTLASSSTFGRLSRLPAAKELGDDIVFKWDERASTLPVRQRYISN
ncbi:hypothetical protein VTI28DRAFT_5111 [Corynascus sepedonium]